MKLKHIGLLLAFAVALLITTSMALAVELSDTARDFINDDDHADLLDDIMTDSQKTFVNDYYDWLAGYEEENEPTCYSGSSVKCSGNNLYSYDSCGNRESGVYRYCSSSGWTSNYRCNLLQPQRQYHTGGCSGSSCRSYNNWKDYPRENTPCTGSNTCSNGYCTACPSSACQGDYRLYNRGCTSGSCYVPNDGTMWGCGYSSYQYCPYGGCSGGSCKGCEPLSWCSASKPCQSYNRYQDCLYGYENAPNCGTDKCDSGECNNDGTCKAVTCTDYDIDGYSIKYNQGATVSCGYSSCAGTKTCQSDGWSACSTSGRSCSETCSSDKCRGNYHYDYPPSHVQGECIDGVCSENCLATLDTCDYGCNDATGCYECDYSSSPDGCTSTVEYSEKCSTITHTCTNCTDGWGNCNQQYACEKNLKTDNNNCGSCGNVCDSNNYEKCIDGECIACTPEASYSCYNNDVYYYDSCGDRGEKKGDGECSDGEGGTNLYRCDDNQLQRKYWISGCYNDINYYLGYDQDYCYTSYYWQDLEACTSNQICDAASGTCKDCIPNTYIFCSNAGSDNDAYHYDSCLNKGSIAYDCRDGAFWTVPAVFRCNVNGNVERRKAGKEKCVEDGNDFDCQPASTYWSISRYCNPDQTCDAATGTCKNSCAKPSNVQCDSIGSTKFHITWNSVSGATNYKINWVTGYTTTSSTGAWAMGLSPYTNYPVKVRVESTSTSTCAVPGVWSDPISCITERYSCIGTIRLDLEPNEADPSQNVIPSASGLTNCAGRTIEFKKDSCSGEVKSSCVIGSGGTGCTGNSFPAEDRYGKFDYYACMN